MKKKVTSHKVSSKKPRAKTKSLKSKKLGLKIYLFRHGISKYNRDHKFTGIYDSKLTRKGKKNAKTIALKLKDKTFQVAIRTRLSRSKNTLRPVLKYHPECKVIFEDDRMIERNYGELQGMKHDDFIDMVGMQLYDLKVHGDFMADLEPAYQKRMKNFLGKEEYEAIHRGFNVRPPGGESFADVEIRVKDFIKDLKIFMKKNSVNVAISAHGNSIRLFRRIIEGASKEETVSWFIPYDKVYTYII
ncbi:MAG: phosphoglycerate mutase family protein [Nanoarchaeota archaeon]|nr:phosphoglycerate mutase family protein [Nanoarchaeota archaeon]